MIADIDAGFGNAEATYLLAKKMIEAGACAPYKSRIRFLMRNSVATRMVKSLFRMKTFSQKIRACRYAFMELGIENGVIVTRTDSLGCRSYKADRLLKGLLATSGDQIQFIPGLRRSDPRYRQQWRCDHQPEWQDDASKAPSFEPLFQFKRWYR